MSRPVTRPFRQLHGFTLIEVLVALLILSVLAATAWKGMDAISTSRQVAEDKLRQTLRVQSVMTQWEADLGQVTDTLIVPGLQFDGGQLRLTRRAVGGVQVVTWLVRDGRLLRWASPETTRVGELQQHWQRAAQLQGSEPGALVALEGIGQWQVFCFRDGSLSNCQSTGNVVQGMVQMPQALRVQLVLAEGSGFGGNLTRDMMIAPQTNN
ncbi:prepilin-type N-terminal cleavage/methylation domain-containing protein [Aquabacterium fontiphilum]|uniref:prepilin-type N-terminal cleavage/methylation domain-containing protein n=1 Tax=Aquabacterium fontiphilum TaxID=450365 RepID=UPI001378CC18|nr:prepilin-type N-terminal cleavage/methylation domain-containing protein [Aquabacterium fontiphilum]NBD19394.1 prepilin-type N-terminal cleavage/methylation domain-containing protein [Aquabacterium fontiphilum]